MRGTTKPCVCVVARVRPMSEAQLIGWLEKQAEGEVRRGGGSGGRRRGASACKKKGERVL
jgi:hypothetical protein